ncbi:hypothetical protein D1007_30301 [Hordeum vulgare]|nr:hypothetical protein D1007_30301 [Hordeum vulgare]
MEQEVVSEEKEAEKVVDDEEVGGEEEVVEIAEAITRASRNAEFNHKPLPLHHCYKELCKNGKWIQRIAETTPKRSRLSISIEEDDEVDEYSNNKPEDNMVKWNELEMVEDGKWKAKLVDEERKVKVKEHRLALEEERIHDAKKIE